MDPQLLKYYSEELVYMRSLAGEFAEQHPKIAKRLGMQGTEVADPYVERLIESFCFLSARTRIKLDAEFPNFTQRLLEVIYPNYISPTPSIAIAQFNPSKTEGNLTKGHPIPKQTALFAKIPAGEDTACEFRTGFDVNLRPIEITEAKLAGIPPDIPALDRYLPAHIRPQASLRLRFKTTNGALFSELSNLDELPLYLSGDEQIASHLHELLLTSSSAVFVAAPQKMSQNPYAIKQDGLVPYGLSVDQSLLPCPWSSFHGHNLIQSYFASPNQFYFVCLKNLAPGLSLIESDEIEVVVVLTKQNETLINLIDKNQFALYCTPIINLFPKRTDRVEVNPKLTEYHLIADRSRPLDYEIFSIEKVIAQQGQTSEDILFRPLFQTLRQDEGNHGRYFSTRREARLDSNSARKYGTRTSYIGSELFISLVDQFQAPFSDSIRYLSVQALLTNRDLPRLVPRNGLDDLTATDSIPTSSIGLIRAPSVPRPPIANGEMAWRLIRQLSFNHVPLMDLDHREGAQAFREMIGLFVRPDDEIMQRQIQGLIGTQIKPIVSRLPGSGPLVYGRGVQCQLTIDEDKLSGTSPFLFGLVLEHYLTKHVAINTFTQTKLSSIQRGDIMTWPPRMGSRGVV